MNKATLYFFNLKLHDRVIILVKILKFITTNKSKWF